MREEYTSKTSAPCLIATGSADSTAANLLLIAGLGLEKIS
jgi:hypothetical protein